ncbi:2-C-methyl-D-erythritol 2,4-cyclodiphosphate synthase [Haliea sp. AH-315-K21]|uniref:2-C-methyl-D-erythritol 2,4-cyclodiphosphate synthase n=1 Tax=SAR86 cluster bacterium TaxID=2030880 RepID=A0A2A5C999_9GAMM|nr:2-C-methyl-D-erythritol 2,4-cyclodiphosphate synthase [Haliea sp. AH-315-K21]PCJ40407.1 MAG: 2-C-methyl-D-erythritol 2,4-cyclodiphosphate synthase [SAR86 cluster bacterium]
MLRIGSGFDVHRFAVEPQVERQKGASIILAGIKIPHTHMLEAHSDGDVLSHALCDALLGALALGDIGQHFPDTDPQFENISSLLLLQHTYQLLKNQGWHLVNTDITIIAEQPMISPYQLQMRQSLADVMELSIDQFSIKATTSEGLGFTGRGEGIAVQAVALIEQDI